MIQALQDIFASNARLPEGYDEQASRSDNGSKADNMDSWTLEYTFDRFKNFLKKLERVAAADPREALNMLRTTLNDKVFSAPAQIEKLERKARELEIDSPANSIEHTFARSVLNLSTREPKPAEFQPLNRPLLRPDMLSAA